MEYRQLAKLKSTYADGLSNFIQADGRFMEGLIRQLQRQEGLVVQRPNLQNIPVRMELGRRNPKSVCTSRGICVL